jgi:hypothetical protein
MSKSIKPIITEHPRKAFISIFNELCYSHSRWRVFQDFCEMAAIELRQPFYKNEKDEERYKEIARQYPKKYQLLAELFTSVVFGLEVEGGDFLGSIFHELEMQNENMGQFFTPYCVQKLMAQMNADKDHLQGLIDRNGYITMNEPCSGAGGMVLAFAETFKELGFNPSTQLFVITQDLDFTATHMTYVQLALSGIAGLIERRNTITQELYFQHYTPVYFFAGWPQRLRLDNIHRHIRRAIEIEHQAESEPATPEPVKVPEPIQADLIIEPNGQIVFNF